MKSDYLLNWKAFLITLVMGVIVVPSVYFIHRSQLSKLQSFLLKDIEASKVSGDSEKAIKNLNRYLMYRPDSPRQKVDLTRLLMNREKDQLPLKLLIPMIVQAIGICESNQDLVEESKVFREKLIDSLMQDPSRWTDALEQMTKFAKDDPSPDLNRKMALVRSRKLLFLNADAKDGLVVPKTAPWVEEKLSMDPLDHLLDALSENLGDIELTDMIGKLIFPKSTYMAKSKLAQLGPKELNAVFKNMLEDMKEEHPDSAIAWGVDYRYMSLIDPEQARKDIEWALEKYSDNIEISREGVRYLVYRAATLARDGDSVNAENFLDRAMILLNNRKENEKTKDSFTYSQLAKIYLQKNQVDAAIETIEDGMRICPAPVIDLKLLLARIQLASGDSGKAWEAIKSAEETLRREAPILQTSVQKDFAIEVKELKVAYYSSKDDLPALNQELESYVVGATATTAEAEYRILDLAIQNYRKIGFWEKAADAYQRAIAIDPRNPAMRRGAAEAFAKINRLDEAIKQIEAISIKQPGDWMQLGTILLLKYANNEELAEESDWSRIQFAIDKARETSVALENGESFRNMLDVLQADLDIRRLAPSKRAEKVAVLKPRFLELCKSYPDDELLLRNVFSLFSVWGELKDAELVREIMSKANPNGVDSVIGEATRLAGANGAQSALDYLWSVLGKYQIGRAHV